LNFIEWNGGQGSETSIKHTLNTISTSLGANIESSDTSGTSHIKPAYQLS